MQRKSISSRAFWVIIIGGMVTGMGNGSVFGAAMMCFLGRGEFGDWGGPWPVAYEVSTFTGFIDWCMIVFGLAYIGILWIALQRHDKEENAPDAVAHKA
jgi:cbb3-type cytochrome oxidase subunit 3